MTFMLAGSLTVLIALVIDEIIVENRIDGLFDVLWETAGTPVENQLDSYFFITYYNLLIIFFLILYLWTYELINHALM